MMPGFRSRGSLRIPCVQSAASGLYADQMNGSIVNKRVKHHGIAATHTSDNQ